MKLSVMQENLARGLSVVSRAVSNRSTLPVLANVLLKTEDAGLKLTATNLEIGITYWVPGKIETDGATTVPAKLLTDLVNSLPAGDRVDLELAGRRRRSTSGAAGSRSHIKGIDADEFPAIRAAGERPTTRIAQNVLRQALDETAFAAASDEARPILTGVLARFEGDQLTLAAADNYRIAVKTIPILDAGRGDERRHPGPGAQRAGPDPGRHRRPGRGRPRRRRATRSCSTSTGSTSSAASSTASSRTTSRSCRRATRPGPSSIARSSSGRSGRRRSSPTSRPTSSSSRSAPTASPGSRSAPTPRSATTSARSRPPSRATGRRSRSTPATWPTS